MPKGCWVRAIDNLVDLKVALDIRFEVFVHEQDVPREEELDHYDEVPTCFEQARHVLAFYGEQPVATARIIPDKPAIGCVKIGRVAVKKDFRRYGVGREMMKWCHNYLEMNGFVSSGLASQLQAIPFYESLGYQAYGEIFLDANIEHRWMTLNL
ncbi:MAG: GNAT family N-acetyltransferase [Myxococcota bacterium]|nr:GNAT family N-acetyltransferase [Myxococcota bacterium]